MADKKIIAVVGATGQQGSGLVKAILADPAGGFAARAIARDPNSDKAKELARLGAEVVAWDVDDDESLKRAFAGAHGAYCVTFFWAHFSPERETAQGTAMARAAEAAGVKHVIWSTLEDSRKWIPLTDNRMPTLKEKYKVPHFDAKGEADQVFSSLGVPTAFLLTSFYSTGTSPTSSAPRATSTFRAGSTPGSRPSAPGSAKTRDAFPSSSDTLWREDSRACPDPSLPPPCSPGRRIGRLH
jgi:uncharacterized protein YbjT (DUF2867 family)